MLSIVVVSWGESGRVGKVGGLVLVCLCLRVRWRHFIGLLLSFKIYGVFLSFFLTKFLDGGEEVEDDAICNGVQAACLFISRSGLTASSFRVAV